MNFTYLKLLVFGVVGALTLSVISLFCLVRISEMVVDDYRYGYLLYIARAIERSAEIRPLNKIKVSQYRPPPPPKDSALTIFEATNNFNDPQPPVNLKEAKEKKVGPSLWLVNTGGEIISTNTSGPTGALPKKWEELPRPKKVHGFESNDGFFESLLAPKTFVMKLDTAPTSYLVSENERSLLHGPFVIIQGIHTFTTAALAVFLALSISFYYLRRKSIEARKVLSKLETGDLKARFEIKTFDEFGNLMLDFNRMADQIERLVKRLSETEASRSNLLQELGHDLRTPLTSLNTSIETLKEHFEVIEQEDRNELFNMISADIRYFTDLLEKLTVVATIEGPHYKASTETIDLQGLLEEEVRNRQAAGTNTLMWNFQKDEKLCPIILGDQHLIMRLFKNAFDNASKYARSVISVKLKSYKDKIEVLVIDDGPGLSTEAIEAFGKRRERRHVKERDAHDFSLGLGSVIMKTIAEAHDGHIHMGNITYAGQRVSGACLHITFKRS